MSFDKLYISGLSKISLTNIYIPDHKKDTLLFIEALDVRLGTLDPRQNLYSLFSVHINGALARIVTDQEGFNFDYLLHAFASDTDSVTSKTGNTLQLICDQLTLENTEIRYTDLTGTITNADFQSSDIQLNKVSLRAEGIHYDDSLQLRLSHFSASEKSGLAIARFEALLKLSEKELKLNNLQLKTGHHTHVKLTELVLAYNGYDDFACFMDSVSYQLTTDSLSWVDMKDGEYFANELKGSNIKLGFSADISGSSEMLYLNNLVLKTGNYTQLQANANAFGISNFEEALMHIDIEMLRILPNDLLRMRVPNKYRKYYIIPDELLAAGLIVFEGSLTGFYDDFAAYGNLTSDIGSIKSDAKMSQLGKKQYRFEGKIASTELNLGILMNDTTQFGMVSFSGETQTQIYGDSVSGTVNAVIDRIYLNGYDYNQILANGEFTDRSFRGGININDDNLMASFLGEINYEDTTPKFKFDLKLNNARLDTLNVEQIDTASYLSLEIESDFEGNKIDEITGFLNVKNINYKRANQYLQTDSIHFMSVLSKNADNEVTKDIRLTSDIASASIYGRFNYLDFVVQLQAIASSYLPTLLPTSVKQDSVSTKSNEFEWSVYINDLTPYTKMFAPQIGVAPNSDFFGDYNFAEQEFSFAAITNYIDLPGAHFEQVKLTGNGNKNKFNLKWRNKELKLASGLSLNRFTLTADLQSDSLWVVADWNRKQDSLKFYAKIVADSTDQHPIISINFLESYFIGGSQRWTIEPSSIIIDTTSISINNFGIKQKQKRGIRLNGCISENPIDSMMAKIVAFNLKDLYAKNSKQPYLLEGIMFGSLKLKDLYGKPYVLLDNHITLFKVNKEYMGDVSLVSNWDNTNDVLQLEFDITNNRENYQPILITGEYLPENSGLDFTVILDKLKLNLLQPSFKGILSDIDMQASTRMLMITGATDTPIIWGELNLDKGGFKVDFLQTEYFFDEKHQNKIVFDENVIELNELILNSKPFGKNKKQKFGTAKVTGLVNHNYFDNINYEVNMSANDFPLLNTAQTDSSFFFGTAVAEKLLLNVSGDSGGLILDVSIKTGKGTTFAVPLDGYEEVEETDFITFVSRRQSAEGKKPKYNEAEDFGMALNINLEATPDAEMQMIFDARAGDVIKGRGYGDLKVEITENGDFNMFGDYTIEEGSYLFTLERVFSKKFEVAPGGTIKWEGDPLDADIDLDAIYKIKKVSLHDLIPEDENVGVKIPITCHLYLGDQLLSPSLKFGIDSESGSDDVNSSISSLSEDERNKQMLSLLLMNRFQPLATYNTDMSNISVGQSTSELLSNQLNVWLGQMSNDFDIGLNYQTGDSLGNTEVGVALSTSLWDDRINVNSNLGVAGTSGTSDFSGDVNVDVKLNRSGKLRFKAFAETADPIQYGTDAYTQGMGIFYREDFNTFGELFRRFRNKLTGNKYSLDKLEE